MNARIIACYLLLSAVLGVSVLADVYVATLPTKHDVRQIVTKQTNATPVAIEKAAKLYMEQQAAYTSREPLCRLYQAKRRIMTEKYNILQPDYLQAGIAITSADVVSFRSDGDTATVVLKVKAVGLPGTTKIKVTLTKGVYQATGLVAA